MVQKLYTPIGDLRESLTLYDTSDPETSRGPQGEVLPPSVVASSIPAKVEVLQGRELLKSQQLVADVDVRVIMRFRRGVTSKMTCSTPRGLKLEVKYVLDPDQRQVELHLLCASRT